MKNNTRKFKIDFHRYHKSSEIKKQLEDIEKKNDNFELSKFVPYKGMYVVKINYPGPDEKIKKE